MTGKNTLNGWDALMSYDQTVINQMLQQRGKAMGILDPIVIERQYRGGYLKHLLFVAILILTSTSR